MSRAISRILDRSSITYLGILFDVKGRQSKAGFQRSAVSNRIVDICDRLIKLGRHPALLLAKARLAPFNIFDFEDECKADSEVEAFFQAMRQDGFASAYSLPVRDLDGELYVAGAVLRGRMLTEMEVRMIHSFCMESVGALGRERDALAARRDEELLTDRERECLVAAARGLTEKVTARRLSISPNTVHTHLENCRRKLGARNKLDAIVKALQSYEIVDDDLKAS